jgi:oxygen-independent coproporphyrinogen-3 oxidase
LLDGPAVAQVRDLARAHFTLEIGEFSLEANPAAGSAGLLAGWREAGVDRLSIGAQSFDDGVLRTLGRDYSADEALRFCRSARTAGFDVLAVDLMVGVPGETADAVNRTLDRLLGIGPDHVSVYFLENVEGLPFAEVLADRPVDQDRAVDHFETAGARLEAAGLRRYEISNFAKPGRECRHNLKYWRYEPYVGLGPSACSHVAGRRWCNEAALDKWAEAAGRSGRDEEDVLELTPEAAAREALVFGLRLVEGVDLADLEARTGAAVASHYAGRIGELASEGLLVRTGTRVRIPAGKLLVSNASLSRLV